MWKFTFSPSKLFQRKVIKAVFTGISQNPQKLNGIFFLHFMNITKSRVDAVWLAMTRIDDVRWHFLLSQDVWERLLATILKFQQGRHRTKRVNDDHGIYSLDNWSSLANVDVKGDLLILKW